MVRSGRQTGTESSLFDDGSVRGGGSLNIGLLLLLLCGGDGQCSSEKVGGMRVCACVCARTLSILF